MKKTFYLNISNDRVCGYHTLPFPNSVEYKADENFETYLFSKIGKLLYINGEIIEEVNHVDLNIELFELKNWLSENDYVINKFILGEYLPTDQKWINYLEQRAIKLKRINEIEVIIGS